MDEKNASIARPLPPLTALRTFEAAARLESFKRAAAELGVTPTAVSHHIRRLEADLGVVLFHRATRRVTLTEEGRALHGPVRQGFEAMAEAVARLRRRPVRQVATLSATLAFTARLLVPRVARFRARFPGWDLRLTATDEPVDLLAGEADAAIRYGAGPYPGLEAVDLMADRFAPACAPHLGIRTPADLGRATLIHVDPLAFAPGASVPSWRHFAARAGLKGLDSAGGIAFNDEGSAIQAAIAGQGIALVSLVLAAGEIERGTLVCPFGPTLEGLTYRFVAPGGGGRPAAQVLRQWVTEEFAAHDNPADPESRRAARGATP
ncbi:LysR substrate-binding domain-containing protein [Ancylobacter lacus]|uniref:LysR substrate-binding domain-containing protein n=1 Tax=Ancylobacter lacus TaxID=2579970 RepID=UPI001BCF102A|nr:LysR substrate-binding domain-containing protein [Ancylobacter lacus]MBS7540753.1 LysR family transcriptional regulator [Ancylobacter lacus]